MYCIRDLPVDKRVWETLMIGRIFLVGSSLECKVLMLEYAGCHVLAVVIDMYVGL